MVGSTYWTKHDYNTFSKNHDWCIWVKTWLQHISEKHDLQHILKKKISWLQGIVEKRDWDTLWNIHDYNIFYKKIIAIYFGKKMIARTFCRKSMIGSTYWKKHDYNTFWKNDWLHILKQTWFDKTFWKKTWLQHILEKNYNNTFLKIQDWKTFWKKNMIIAHSEKSMATLPEKNYWLHILEKHVFF